MSFFKIMSRYIKAGIFGVILLRILSCVANEEIFNNSMIGEIVNELGASLIMLLGIGLLLKSVLKK